MKKLLMMAAIAGFAFASCTSENDDYSAQNNKEAQISFAAPVMYKTASRAFGDVNGKVFPDTVSFRVFGINYKEKYVAWDNTQTNPVTNEFVEDADGVGTLVAPKGNPVMGWFPATKHLFKDGLNYAFAAYSPSHMTATYNPVDRSETAPSQGAVVYGKNGLEIPSYTVAALGEQVDFMYSNRVYDINKDYVMATPGNNNPDYNGVNLVFKHAMSSIHFKTCIDPTYIKATEAAGYKVAQGAFKIKEIRLENAKNQGAFKENINLTKDNQQIYESAAAWTPTESKATYQFFLGNGSAYVNVPFPTTDDVTTSAVDVTDKAIFTNDKGYSGILMPQALGADCTVVIDWSYQETNDEGVLEGPVQNKTSTLHLKDITKNADTSKNGMWLPGKRYIYNIIFKENLIYFAPQVEEWEDAPQTILPN